jgi:hypothetical protein
VEGNFEVPDSSFLDLAQLQLRRATFCRGILLDIEYLTVAE